MTRALLLVLAISLLPVALNALTVTADITTDTTWTSSDSPVIINPAGSSGGTITVRNEATLTIDSSGGAVIVRWNENCDFRIGDGTEEGTLHLLADGNSITFEVRTGGNIAVANTGQVLSTDATSQVIFTRYSTNTWGALDFEAGQTRTSILENCAFSYGGSDSHNGIIHVRDSATNLPKLTNISFSNCTGSAIRVDGEGINVLAEGNITGPISVASTTYFLNLQTTVSTAEHIRFPDIEGTTAPLAQFTGNQTIGSSTAISHWRFDDAWEFVEVVNTPAVVIVQGSIWGTDDRRPVFRTTSGTSKSAWTGIQLTSGSYANVFGGDGPLGFVEVRNASVGIDIDKGTSYTPDAGGATNWRWPGLVLRMCGTGIRVRTALGASAPFEGYTTVITGAVLGGTTTSDDCTTCLQVDHGRVVVEQSTFAGATTSNITVGSGTSVPNDVTIRECRLSDAAATYSINLTDCAAAGSVTIERTSIFTATTGILFQQTSGTPTRSLTIRNSCVTALTTCLSLNITTATVASLLVEDSTIGGTSSGTTQRGILATQMNSSSTATFRRCNITLNREYGFQTGTSAGNTCEYTFEECAVTDNGDGGTGEGGIRDSRNNGARVVAVRCTFQGNNPNGVYDNQAAAATLAENCYWGASDGPGGSGPGSGDAIATSTDNVVASPYLSHPYFESLLGGSPASASAWNVLEDSTTLANPLHVVASDPYFKWVFASDFAAETQSAYQIQVSTVANFASTVWDTGKQSTTSAAAVQYAGSALNTSSLYFARVALWNQSDRRGPWRVLTFRRNATPGTVGDTDRSPGDDMTTPAHNDATPQLVFRIPADDNGDPLHFEIELDTSTGYNTGNLRTLDTAEWLGSGGFAEYSVDDGTTWLPWPATGAPSGVDALARVTAPHTYPNSAGVLTNAVWYWRVRASDGFSDGSWSSDFGFNLSRNYVFSGSIVGAGLFDIAIYRAPGTLVASDSSVSGSTFSVDSSLALEVNDRLVIAVSGRLSLGGGFVAALLTNFTGGDMSNLDLVVSGIVVDSRTDQPVSLAHFACDDDVDSLIPWDESSGTVEVSSSIGVVNIDGLLNVDFDGYFLGAGVEFTISTAGTVVVSQGLLRTVILVNNGQLEVLAGAELRLHTDLSQGLSKGHFRLFGTLHFEHPGTEFTIGGGTSEFRNASISGTADGVSLLVLDSSPGYTAVLDCTGTTFAHVKLHVEADGVVAAFNNNVFNGTISGSHIYWNCEDSRANAVFRGVRFDTTFTQGSHFNVSASAGARTLLMLGGGGVRNGEAYDNTTNDGNVLFEFLAPENVSIHVGDTRLRLEWTDSEQALPPNAGYNVFRSTDPNATLPWGTALNGGTPLTDPWYNDSGLTNGTTYYYYVTCAGSGVGFESKGSARVSAKPIAPELTATMPEAVLSNGVTVMTVLGANTHWGKGSGLTDSEFNATGASGTITINEQIVISPTLIILDISTASYSATTLELEVTDPDIWGVSAYDEVVDISMQIAAPASETVPTIAFVVPSADADTSTAFDIELSFSANGGASIDDTSFEFMVSRVVSHDNADRDPGTNLAAGSTDIFDTVTTSGAEASIEGAAGAGDQRFYDGEYILSARIANVDGVYSHWVKRRIYVNGASGNLIKVPDDSGTPVKLLQGETQTITITGSGLSGTPDFGADIDVLGTSGSGASMDVTVYVHNLADAGPRTITTNSGSKAGIATVAYPTDLLPVVNNDEPSRNPAIGGLNVFLVNGEFFKAETDIAIRGRMMGVNWSRFYRSGISYNGPMGQNWVGHYFQRAMLVGTTTEEITWYTPDGRSEYFEIDVGVVTVVPDGIYAIPQVSGGIVTLLDRHGNRCVFNTEGRLWRCFDRNGNFTECEYNYAGQLVRVYNDRGDSFDVEYHDHGRVSKFADPLWDSMAPREVEYEYDTEGNLVRQLAPETDRYAGADRITYAYRYDAAHRLTDCINPREFAESGNPVSYMQNVYDDQGRVISQRLGEQDQWLHLRYTTTTGLVRELDRRGLLTEYTVDADGRTEKIERFTGFFDVDRDAPIDHDTLTGPTGKLRAGDPDSYVTELTYNADHEVLTVKSPRAVEASFGSATTEYTYDDMSSDRLAQGNVLEVRQVDYLGIESDLVTTYTYESQYQFVKTVTNPRGHTTTYHYDYEQYSAGTGNLVMVVSPSISGSMPTDTITTRTTYNQYGQPVAMVDGEGNVTVFQYDASGFLQFRIAAWGSLNLTSEYEYDNVGNMVGSWPPRAFEGSVTKDDFKSTFHVNELNQTWKTERKLEVGGVGTLSLETVRAYSYFDPNGNLTQAFREYVTFDGTPASTPGDEHDPSTFTKSSSPMAATWVESSATYNLLNYAVTSTRDAVAGSAITQYTSRTEYDANYNVVASISPLGNRSHTIYDERDMVFRRIAGAESDVAASYETDYDENGNVIASRDASGNETVYEYDGFDRTVLVTDPAGNYRESDYDANGNVVESRAYDSQDTLLALSQSTFDQIDRAYTSRRLANDHRGNPIGDGWATNSSVLDKNSRVVSSTNDSGITHYSFYDAANRTTHTRDAIGNETHFVYNAHGVAVRTNYREINALDGSIEISHTEVVINIQDSVIESRDRRYTATTFDTSTKVIYDGWGRVIVSEDAANNTVTHNYDLLSRTTDTTEENGTDDIQTRFEYDAESRVLVRAIKRNPGASTWQETGYEYDERGRLTTLRRPDSAATGDHWAFRYDANGNQLGWTDPLGTIVTTTYDNRNLATFRNIQRGTGIVGVTDESYAYDGLGRLQSCNNYEGSNLITATAWQYNTLSMPERHDQTIADYEGTIIGSWSTFAEYDGSGFNTASIYSDGRRVQHTPDQLNRLLVSHDLTNNMALGVFTYAGPGRIVERSFANGTRSKYYYEASGCGCGGSTGLCERVEHIRNDGSILWATDRRYDVRGLVTAERRDQEGAMGNVFRYDDASRLVSTFYGVDLYDTLLDDFANPANVPDGSTEPFGLNRQYDLDPRGNRAAVTDYDTTLNDIYEYSYTANADTNQYTDVDGASFDYDALEQLTSDPTRGLGYAYDYKGQLVTEDRIGDTPGTPERHYSYDNQGRRRLEQAFYEASNHNAQTSIMVCFPNDACFGGCGCANPGTLAMEELVYDGSGAFSHSVQYSYGPGAHGSLSGSALNPATLAGPPGAMAHGPVMYLEYVPPGSDPAPKWNSRYEDQLGSMIGMADLLGTKLVDYVYLDYGRPVERRILVDGRAGWISDADADTPLPGITTLEVDAASLAAGTDELAGMQLYISLPYATADRVRAGTILWNDADTIWVEDPDDLIFDALDPMGSIEADWVVYDFRANIADTQRFFQVQDVAGDTVTTDPIFLGNEIGWVVQGDPDPATIVNMSAPNTLVFDSDQTGNLTQYNFYQAERPGDWTYPTTAGTWTAAPSFLSGVTTLTATGSRFETFMEGWLIAPDAACSTHGFAYLEILEVTSTNSLTVKGDLTWMVTGDERFWIFAPPSVDAQTGAIRGTHTGATFKPAKCDSRYLWAQYRYMPPMAGYEVDPGTPGIYGRQPGTNQAGTYHAWNRQYDPGTGRWTTPDPAASPWGNLWDYVGGNPHRHTDPSGLDDLEGKTPQEVWNEMHDEASGFVDESLHPLFSKGVLHWLKGGGKDLIIDWDDIMVNDPAEDAVDAIKSTIESLVKLAGTSLACGGVQTLGGAGKESVNSKPSLLESALIAGGTFVIGPIIGPIGAAGWMEEYRRQLDVWTLLGKFDIHYYYTGWIQKVCDSFEYCGITWWTECEIEYRLGLHMWIADLYNWDAGREFSDPLGVVVDWKADNINKAKDVGAMDYITRAHHAEEMKGSVSCD